MPTTITKTIKSSGGDYSSIVAYEAALGGTTNGDLVTYDEIARADCYNFEDTSGVTFDGWTTGSGNYIYLFGVDAPTSPAWSTSRYRLKTSDTVATFRCNEDFLRVENLQIQQTDTSARATQSVMFPNTLSASADIRFINCYIWTSGNNATYLRRAVENASPGTLYILNTVIISYGTNSTTSQAVVYNVTGTTKLYNCCVSSKGYYGVRKASGTVIAKNTYVGTSGNYGFSNATLTTCAASDSTGTYTVPFTTDTFSNVTDNSENFSLVAASKILRTAGTDTSGEAAPLNFTDDMMGNERDTTFWGIGVHTFPWDFPDVASVLDTDTVNGSSGTYHAPDANEVVNTAVFGPNSSTSGTVELPDEGDVRDAVQYGADGTEFEGTIELPAEADVEDGVEYGAGGTEYTGTVTLPAVGDVEDGVQYGAGGTQFEGTLALPAVGDVEDGIQYGAGGTEFEGTVVLPVEEDVEDGVQYGAGGTEFEGTLAAASAIQGTSILIVGGY